MNQIPIERILVALDASADSLAALKAAAKLASILEAELIGLFIEDINLLRLARLPYAQEVSYPMAAARRVNTASMERQLKAQAESARSALIMEAENEGVTCSFRVARGPVGKELMAAAADADLIALGKVSHHRIRSTRLGSTAKIAIDSAPRPVLLMHPGVDLNQPVLLIYDDSGTSRRALSAASYLASVSGRLRVLICAGNEDTAQEHEHFIRHHMRETEVQLTFRRLYQPEPANLAYILSLSGVGLLVLGSAAQLPAQIIHTVLEELDHAVLIVP